MLSSLEILRDLFEIYDFLKGIGRRYTHTQTHTHSLTATLVLFYKYSNSNNNSNKLGNCKCTKYLKTELVGCFA